MQRTSWLRRNYRYIVGVVVLVALAILIWHDLREYLPLLPALWLKVSNKALILLIGLQIASYLMSSLLSYCLLIITGARQPFKNTLKVAVIAELGAGLIPVAGGPAVSYFAFRKLGVPKQAATFAVTTETVLLAATYAFFFVLSLGLPPYPEINALWSHPVLLIIAIVLIAFAIFYLFKHKGGKYVAPIIETWRTCADRPFALLGVFALTLAYYFIDVLMLFSAFHTFGAAPGIGNVIFGMLTASGFVLASNSGLLPGVPEAALVFAFSKLGIAPHIALSAALLYRVVTYWIWVPLSFIFISHTWKWLQIGNGDGNIYNSVGEKKE